MKRNITLAILLATAAVSHAGINFNISNPDATVVKPSSGFVLVDFTGTITTAGGFAPKANFDLELPSNGSTSLVLDHIDAGLQAYLTAGAVDSNYAGALFTLQVQSTDADGLYDMNNSAVGESPFAEAVVHATKDGIDASDNEFYSVTVNSVPEPGTLGLMGIGLSAILARRKRR